MEMDNCETKDSSQCVRVAVNVRPLVTPELLVGCTDCITVVPGEPQVWYCNLLASEMYHKGVVCDFLFRKGLKFKFNGSFFVVDFDFSFDCVQTGSNWIACVHLRLCLWQRGIPVFSDLCRMCCSYC